ISFSMEIGHFEAKDNDADDQRCFNASAVNGPLVAGCFGTDTDFDGTSYQADWPDGGLQHPTSIRITSSRGHGIGPLSASRDRKGIDHYVNPYATLQFETGASASDPACTSPSNCFLPPQGAKFYPFYALRLRDADNRGGRDDGKERERSEHCALVFGNFSGPGINNFAGIAQYGSPDTARAFRQHVSAVQPNPCLPRVADRDDDDRPDRD